MHKKIKRIIFVLIVCSAFTRFNTVLAKTDDLIHFNDKNLEDALCNAFSCDVPITKEMAHELSTKETYLSLWNKNISDLEGIQYFDGLYQIDLSYNNISNLKPLSLLPNLGCLDISGNSIKGKELENTLISMGNINNLDTFECYNNAIEDISFLQNIGNLSNYTELDLSYNNINNISILKESKNLEYLNLENNRISDFTPIMNLKSEYPNIYLYDNCMIDLKPIKPLFDRMFTGRCGADLTDRFDFYINPVNIIYKNKIMQFPHLTVYYMFQAYAEAIPLIEALGGSAEYDNNTGTLTCKIYNKELIMKDFSNIYTLNGKDKRMTYEMRRMQYDTAYVPVEDLCSILGLNYYILKERSLYTGDSEFPEYAPEIVEISVCEVSDRTDDYKYEITDNQAGIIKYLGTEANVIIPSQINGYPVTYIEDGAFCDDINLASVEIPDTMTMIGTAWGTEGVFADCDNLIGVKLNEGKEDASIGENAFLNCSKLSEITIPGNYKVISDNAFNNCTSLKTVTFSEGVERIEAGAFAGDEALVSVTLPSTIKALGYRYDKNDTTDPYYLNQTGVFSFCTGLRQINILKGNTDAYIGANTFSDCLKLESIIIPGNYKAIYNNAFYECEKLKSFVYEKSSLDVAAYQIIDYNAFEGCTSLQEISLPVSLNSIGDYAFIGCTSLKDVVIPEGVKEIGDYAFSETSVESVVIPSTVISIGSSVDDRAGFGGTFYGCDNLASVVLNEGGYRNATIGAAAFQNCIKLEKIIIPGNYITIGEEAFSNCTALKSVIYKDNSNINTKQKILTYAFQSCSNLVAVTLPSTLTLIEFEAFDQCTKLKTITMPTGVNKLYIKDFVFTDCPLLTSIYVEDNVKCSHNSFSLSNSYAKIYTNNKTVKEIAESEEFEVYSPGIDYVNGTNLFGTIDIIGTNEVGSTLQADIDAVVPVNASISYEWIIGGKVAGTESSYTIRNNDKDKTIKLRITGNNEYTGSLTKILVGEDDKDEVKDTDIVFNDNSKEAKSTQSSNETMGEIINNVRYDGYYCAFDEADNTLNLLKFFNDGKVIDVTVEIDNISEFTDKKERVELFDSLEKWFNYDYTDGYGYYKISNGEISFITHFKGIDNGDVESTGQIRENGIEFHIYSHINDYEGDCEYTFLQIE